MIKTNIKKYKFAYSIKRLLHFILTEPRHAFVCVNEHTVHPVLILSISIIFVIIPEMGTTARL